VNKLNSSSPILQPDSVHCHCSPVWPSIVLREQSGSSAIEYVHSKTIEIMRVFFNLLNVTFSQQMQNIFNHHCTEFETRCIKHVRMTFFSDNKWCSRLQSQSVFFQEKLSSFITCMSDVQTIKTYAHACIQMTHWFLKRRNHYTMSQILLIVCEIVFNIEILFSVMLGVNGVSTVYKHILHGCFPFSHAFPILINTCCRFARCESLTCYLWQAVSKYPH